MIAVNFPEANITFGPPPGVSDSQVVPIRAFTGTSLGGSMDGVPIVVTAWTPAAHELEMLNDGHPIFLTVVGAGLPPHMLTTNFKEAVSPR